jgi:nucleoside-diphosphate-sugar epimerase
MRLVLRYHRQPCGCASESEVVALRLLIIGGTRFVGRALVEAALSRDHAVTLFNRGRTEPGLFPDVERVVGDRDGGLEPLRGREFDAVIDTCGYVPRVVKASVGLLSVMVPRYVFVSSLSVYADDSTPGADESAAVGTLADPAVEEIEEDTYGPLKALCEDEVRRTYDDRALVLRCGLIVGPHDYTDRFTYWVRRVAAGGEVLAPTPPTYRVQVIDARDLAAWAIEMLESGGSGTFNATGPDRELTLEETLSTCREMSGSDARFTWVDADFLRDQDVEPWSDLPVWLPGDEYAGFMAVDVARAMRAGLRFRPLADTVRDLLAWDATRPRDHEMRAGLTTDREEALLRAWHGRSEGGRS